MGLDEKSLFDLADKDKNGKLDIKEIGKCFQILRLADTLSIRKIFDLNQDGVIDRAEFN
jgi:Ca2+-binding EF-hand superfamily protein